MKFVLAAVLCALSVKTVLVMPVAEPGVQSDRLAVVPLEKSAPIVDTPHVLRRETSETAAPEVSVHREGETPEEHAKHAHLPTARLEQDAGKAESVKTEESKPLPEGVKLVEAAVDLSDKKEEASLKNEQVIEDAIAAKAAIAEIITPAETLAPIPAVLVASEPVENKAETHVAEGKNAPTKDINSELKEAVKLEGHNSEAVGKIEEPQQIAKSLPDSTKSEATTVVEPIATIAAVADSESSSKDEKKIEPVVAESEQKAAEQPREEVKEAEDKTDRVTRGTEEVVPLDSAQAAPAAHLTSVSAAAPAESVAAVAVAEPKEKLVDEVKEEKTELPEKKVEAVEPVGTPNNEEKLGMAKSSEPSLLVEASETVASVAAAVEKSEKVAEEGLSSGVKAAEQILEAKSAPTELEAQPEAQPSAAAAAAPTGVKPEPVVDTIKAKAESTEASKESTEAVKVEDSSSSEEKSSEEDHSGEKSVETKSSGDLKKDESKVEELPKPQEVKEIKEDE